MTTSDSEETSAMPLRAVDWEPNRELPTGKATLQQFVATLGEDRFEINVAPWGEGQLKVNGREVARTAEGKDRRQAFVALKQAAERYARGESVEPPGNGKTRLIPAVKAKLLEGKRGLVVGIANDQSIAWGCAKAFRAFGAELAVTYLNDKARKHVEPLARALESPIVMPLDAREPGQMEAVFERIASWTSSCIPLHSRRSRRCTDAWSMCPSTAFSRPCRSRAGRSFGWPIWPNRS
jgi:enoyl-[acyl-carrier protein] reductase I